MNLLISSVITVLTFSVDIETSSGSKQDSLLWYSEKRRNAPQLAWLIKVPDSTFRAWWKCWRISIITQRNKSVVWVTNRGEMMCKHRSSVIKNWLVRSGMCVGSLVSFSRSLRILNDFACFSPVSVWRAQTLSAVYFVIPYIYLYIYEFNVDRLKLSLDKCWICHSAVCMHLI